MPIIKSDKAVKKIQFNCVLPESTMKYCKEYMKIFNIQKIATLVEGAVEYSISKLSKIDKIPSDKKVQLTGSISEKTYDDALQYMKKQGVEKFSEFVEQAIQNAISKNLKLLPEKSQKKELFKGTIREDLMGKCKKIMQEKEASSFSSIVNYSINYMLSQDNDWKNYLRESKDK